MSKTCSICEIKLDITQFGNKRSQCRSCMNNRIKQHYKEKGRHYRTIKAQLKEGKLCYICGRNDYLEFAHNNRNNKSCSISKLWGEKKIRDEAEKTMTLCIWCHRIETKNENVII